LIKVKPPPEVCPRAAVGFLLKLPQIADAMHGAVFRRQGSAAVMFSYGSIRSEREYSTDLSSVMIRIFSAFNSGNSRCRSGISLPIQRIYTVHIFELL